MAVKLLCWVLKGFLAVVLMTGAGLLIHAAVYGQSACATTRAVNDSEEATLVTLINQYREQNGIAPLALTTALTRAAISHSEQMATTGTFSHDSIPVTFSRFAACGNASTTIAENIAAGNADAAGTFLQWRTSVEHNATMLNPTYHAVGMGRAFGAYQGNANFAFWTGEFGDQVDAVSPLPVPIPNPLPIPTPLPVPNPIPQPVPNYPICYGFGYFPSTVPAAFLPLPCPFGTVAHPVSADCLARPFNPLFQPRPECP